MSYRINEKTGVPAALVCALERARPQLQRDFVFWIEAGLSPLVVAFALTSIAAGFHAQWSLTFGTFMGAALFVVLPIDLVRDFKSWRRAQIAYQGRLDSILQERLAPKSIHYVQQVPMWIVTLEFDREKIVFPVEQENLHTTLQAMHKVWPHLDATQQSLHSTTRDPVEGEQDENPFDLVRRESQRAAQQK